MKHLYHRDDLRAVVVQKNDWGTKYLKLTVQKRLKWLFFHWWVEVKWIDIEVDNYWGYVPGHELWGRHMTLSYQFGGEREIWPPDIFNLKARMQDLITEYLKQEVKKKLKENATLKQLSTL
jgi:hypothetical protein